MTYVELVNVLKSTDLPVAFNAFEIGTAPSLPFIVYTLPSNNDFIADNSNYQDVVRVNIELYSRRKNFSLEKSVEGVLKANNIVYSKSSVWLDTEQMQQTIYETEIMINEQ